MDPKSLSSFLKHWVWLPLSILNLTLTPHVGHPNLFESQNVVHTRIVSRILMRLGNFKTILPTDDFRF